MKKYLFLVAILLVGIAGCQSGPQFKNHPQPSLTVDYSAFEKVDTVPGCDRLGKPSDLFGGLRPAYPIALCFVWIGYPNSPEFEAHNFFGFRGIGGPVVRYAVLKDGEYRVISNVQELRNLYAPIEWPDEALSYALASDYFLSAYYGLTYTDTLTYTSRLIEDTHVVATSDGYSINLFQYVPLGCANHPTYEVGLYVPRDGEISEIISTKVYTDKSYICGD